MRTSHIMITLTPQESAILAQYQRSQTAPAGLVRRARCVLLRAEGHSLTAIAAKVGITRRHVDRWCRRFQHERLAGLEDKEGRGAQKRNEDTKEKQGGI